MRTAAELSCIASEMEYREWSECPQWYCVKTTLHADSKVESEIVADEKTGIPIAIQDAQKPADGTYETMETTTYYTYHRGYKEAAEPVRQMKTLMAVAI